MKTAQLAMATAAILMASFGEAFAAGGTKVYSSGILVLAFVAICALVVVVQLIPAMMTLWGMIKGASETSKKASSVSAKN